MSDQPLSERVIPGMYVTNDLADEIAVLEHKLIVWDKSHAALEQERDDHIQLKDDWIRRCSNLTDERDRLRAAIAAIVDEMRQPEQRGAVRLWATEIEARIGGDDE